MGVKRKKQSGQSNASFQSKTVCIWDWTSGADDPLCSTAPPQDYGELVGASTLTLQTVSFFLSPPPIPTPYSQISVVSQLQSIRFLLMSKHACFVHTQHTHTHTHTHTQTHTHTHTVHTMAERFIYNPLGFAKRPQGVKAAVLLCNCIRKVMYNPLAIGVKSLDYLGVMWFKITILQVTACTLLHACDSYILITHTSTYQYSAIGSWGAHRGTL